MKNGNVMPFSSEKIIIKRKPFPKVNISKNLHLMNLPEFHLNRTIKAYINSKLNKTNFLQNSTEKIFPSKLNKSKSKSKSKTKTKTNNNNLTRINTITNILNNKKNFSRKKPNKIKVSLTPKSHKKLYKSKSKPKFNISSYILNYRKKCNIKKGNNYLNKSEHKFIRNVRSTNLSNNTTNKIMNKTTSIFNHDNQINSNNSTLDFNNKKKQSLNVLSTSKKSKFNNQFFPEEKRIKIKFSKINNIKNKNNQVKDIILKKKNINNKIDINLDNSFSKKSFNINSDKNMNLNYINNTENNIIYTKLESNHIYFHDCNISDKTLSKFNNITNTNQQSIEINLNNSNKKMNSDKNVINNFQAKSDNNLEYIKKIEKLENENKLLKNEINDSKYKLQLLEDKINKLLLGKNSITMEKEECPQPTPYVKKYSDNIFQNDNNSNFN